MALQSSTIASFWRGTRNDDKAAKRAVNAVLGNADVTDRELVTAFTRTGPEHCKIRDLPRTNRRILKMMYH